MPLIELSTVIRAPRERVLITRLAGIWRVNQERLDGRIEGQRDLVAIAGKSVIPPGEEKFYPALESLRWREEHLVMAY